MYTGLFRIIHKHQIYLYCSHTSFSNEMKNSADGFAFGAVLPHYSCSICARVTFSMPKCVFVFISFESIIKTMDKLNEMVSFMNINTRLDVKAVAVSHVLSKFIEHIVVISLIELVL